jgi:hypothetical protein
MSILDIIGGIVKPVGDVIDSLHTSEEEKMEARRKIMEVEAALTRKFTEYETALTKARSEVVVAEATSQSVLARNWRPILMLVFTYIIAHNYVLSPIFGIAYVDIPTEMWSLLKIGVGGYIVGRSAEKGIATWRNGNGGK